MEVKEVKEVKEIKGVEFFNSLIFYFFNIASPKRRIWHRRLVVPNRL